MFILIPLLLDYIVFENNVFCSVSNDGWASFFGSFCGGIATLFAVLLTLEHNKYEYRQKKEDERTARNEKSALIIFYDFKFAFENIRAVYKASTVNLLFNVNNLNSGTNGLSDYKILLNQLYLDSDWVRNVAELKDCPDIDSQVIDDIYRVYGYLQAILKWKELDNIDTRREAVLAMAKLMKYDESSFDYLLEDDVARVYDKLKNIAHIEETAGSIYGDRL